jgi:hypothetical protein
MVMKLKSVIIPAQHLFKIQPGIPAGLCEVFSPNPLWGMPPVEGRPEE